LRNNQITSIFKAELLARKFLLVTGGMLREGAFLGTALIKYVLPERSLARYAAINNSLLFAAVLSQGKVAVYALREVRFFLSTMFPIIFE
jgi:FHS family L-fucose permease-like MFS transporter